MTEASSLVLCLRAAIRKELPRSVRAVRRYIPIRRYPDIFIVNPGMGLVLNGMRVPDWVRAMTIDGVIYMIAQPMRWSTPILRRVLRHEVFHAAVHAYFHGEPRMPYWLNEALAHALAPPPAVNGARGLSAFVQSAARRLARKQTRARIRQVLERARKSGGFDSSIYTMLGVSPPARSLVAETPPLGLIARWSS